MEGVFNPFATTAAAASASSSSSSTPASWISPVFNASTSTALPPCPDLEDEFAAMMEGSSSSSSSQPLDVYDSLSSCWQRKSHFNCRCRCAFSFVDDYVMSAKVLTYLDWTELAQVARVSKRWHHLCKSPFLWRKVNLAPFANQITDDVLLDLLQRNGSMMIDLRLCGCKKLTSVTLAQVGSFCPRLQELHCCNLNKLVSDDVVISVLSDCARLQRLSLNGCSQVSSSGLSSVSQIAQIAKLSLRGCTRFNSAGLHLASDLLTELNLSGCRSVTREIGALLGRNCPRLAKLNLHGVRVDDAAIEALADGCRMLTHFDISSTNPFGLSSSVTDVALYAMSSLVHLQHLNLEGCGQITDAGLIYLMESIESLQSLNLGGCIKLTDAAIQVVVNSHPLLVSLSLSYLPVSEQTVQLISTKLTHLEKLDMHSSPTVSTKAVTSLLPSLSQLRILDVSSCAKVAQAETLKYHSESYSHIKLILF